MPTTSSVTEQILGIPFFDGSPADAVARARQSGGLVVAPSGTCFARFLEDAAYRRAIVSADLALPDSGAMVALWRLRTGSSLERISGLAYLRRLLFDLSPAELADVCWVLPHARAQEKLLAWSAAENSLPASRDTSVGIDPARCYLAPTYGRSVEDEALRALIAERQPRHVVVAIGAGAQERLGWWLREHFGSTLAIHCIGGALGFVTGDQVAIPDWADRLCLGWFLRFLSQPRAFLPRLWKARVLPALIFRYGHALPPGSNWSN
ncbi:MAG: WecB/TagA/CpsF family glycosyltransferase [Chthoniobacterales bacterium]